MTTRGSDTYTTTFARDLNLASSAYAYGEPHTITTSSNTHSAQRIVNLTYHHDKDDWIIGNVATHTRNGVLFDQYAYDATARLSSIQRIGSLFATFAYHPNGAEGGQLASRTDALNRVIQLSNYRRGVPQTVVRMDNTTISRVVDNFGFVTSETNPRGVTTNYAYNSAGWLTGVDLPGTWNDVTVSYSGLGAGVIQTSTRGNARTITTYDGFHRPTLVETRDLAGAAPSVYRRTVYDGLGRASFNSFPSSSAAAPDGVTTTFDALNRVSQTIENVSPNATTTYAYLTGNKTRVTDPLGAQTTTTYRAFGAPTTDEVSQILDATGTTTTYTRDIYGNITALNQASALNGYSVNVTRQFWYDSRYRLCRHRAPEFGDELLAYDAADRLIQASRGESAGTGCATPSSTLRTSYSYDAMNRRTVVDFAGATPDIANTYDANGNLLTANRGGVNWSYAYNDLDALTSETLVIDGRTYATAYAYNLAGDLSGMTFPGGAVVAYAPNSLGQATQISQGASTFVAGIAYHPNGQAASAAYGNGLTFSLALDARQLPYDIRVSGAGGNVVNLRHLYNARRQVASITDFVDAGQNRSFTYDPRGRLLTASGAWGNGAFVYDGIDNIRSQTLGPRTVSIGYDSVANRVSQVTDSAGGGTRTYTHDIRGNVSGTGLLTLTHDFSNQPVSISGAGVSASYVYDAHMRRVKAVQNGQTVYWVYSSLTGTPIYQDEATGNIQTHYMSGGGAQVRVRNGVAEYTHLDHLGSPVANTNASGGLVWREQYLPFGETTLRPAANDNDTSYTGHVGDRASGLVYMQARYYDPAIGRFLQTDPVGYQGGMNLYAYVGNDPLNLADPTGLIGRCPNDTGGYCDQVKEEAAAAAGQMREIAGQLRGLASAIRGGGELTEEQSALRDTFEGVFGEDSASARNLGRAAGALEGGADWLMSDQTDVYFQGSGMEDVPSATRMNLNAGAFFGQNAGERGGILAHAANHGYMRQMGIPQQMDSLWQPYNPAAGQFSAGGQPYGYALGYFAQHRGSNWVFGAADWARCVTNPGATYYVPCQ